MFNEFIDKFPAGFSLNNDTTYSFQLSRRNPTELHSSGWGHPQHSAVTFLLQKSYLKAKTQLKTPTKPNCFLQNSPSFTPSTVMKTSSAMGAALSHKDGCMKLGSVGTSPIKGACRAPSTGTKKSSFLGRSCHSWVVLCLNNLADLPRKAFHSLYANLSPKAKMHSSSAKDLHTFLNPVWNRVLHRCKIKGVI